MNSLQALRELAPLAQNQRGLFTAAQAAAHGVPRLLLSRMDTRGDLERMVHGVYRMPGTAVDSTLELYAAWLALDPARTATERLADPHQFIAVSHRSAAALYDIGDLPAHGHSFTASYTKQTQRNRMRVSTARLTRAEVRIHDGMLVTAPERTIADMLHAEADESQVADVIADAIRTRLTNVGAISQALAERGGRYSGADVERLLEGTAADMTGRVVSGDPHMAQHLEGQLLRNVPQRSPSHADRVSQ